MNIRILILIFLLSGCANQSEIIGLDYEINDNPKNTSIDLIYSNKTNKAICVTPEMWPDKHGIILVASSRVYLQVGDKNFFMIHENGDYCPGCATKVLPMQKINASIPYSLFNLPSVLYGEEKVLIFDPKPIASYCVKD